MLSWNAAQLIRSDTQASRPFQSIPLRVPFSFLSPTRHCTKWCFVSRQQTVSPPLVTPVSALPSCPMASAPIRTYCRSRFVPLSSRGPCSAEKSNAKGSSDATLARTHSDTSRWLEMVGGQPSEKKKKTFPEEKGWTLNVPLTSRK